MFILVKRVVHAFFYFVIYVKNEEYLDRKGNKNSNFCVCYSKFYYLCILICFHLSGLSAITGRSASNANSPKRLQAGFSGAVAENHLIHKCI